MRTCLGDHGDLRPIGTFKMAAACQREELDIIIIALFAPL